MHNSLILLALTSVVFCHDVIVGTNTEGRKIYDEVRHASPTIWRQAENVTVNTTDAEVISRVVITDLRPDKDGYAKVIEGGEGQNNVTIELKSPTVLRGYEFQIQVFSIPEDKFKSNANKQETSTPAQTRVQRNPVDDKHSTPIVPGIAFHNSAEQGSSTVKVDLMPMPFDTKVNNDKTRPIDANSEKVNQNQFKIGGVPPLVPKENKPEDNAEPSVGIHSVTGMNEQNRHARDALQVNDNDQTPQGKTPDPSHPVIVTRPGEFNVHTTKHTNITNPENKNNGKRDTKDSETGNIDSKSNVNGPVPYPETVLDSKPLTMKTPLSNAKLDNHREDVQANPHTHGHSRHVRSAVNEEDDENNRKYAMTQNKSVPPTMHPINIQRSEAFNHPFQAPNSNSAKTNSGNRDARNAENDSKSDNSSSKPENNQPLHPKISSDFTPLTISTPATYAPKEYHNDRRTSPHGTTNNEHGRHERHTNDDAKETNLKSAQRKVPENIHPVSIPKTGSLNIPSTHVHKEDKNAKTNAGHRDARDTNENKAAGSKLENNRPIINAKSGVTTQSTPIKSASDTQINKHDQGVTGSPNHKIINNHGRHARSAQNAKEDNKKPVTASNMSIPQANQPINIPKQGAFNIHSMQATTENVNDAKRDARDTENDKKIDNVTPKSDYKTGGPITYPKINTDTPQIAATPKNDKVNINGPHQTPLMPPYGYPQAANNPAAKENERNARDVAKNDQKSDRDNFGVPSIIASDQSTTPKYFNEGTFKPIPLNRQLSSGPALPLASTNNNEKTTPENLPKQNQGIGSRVFSDPKSTPNPVIAFQ